MGPFLSGAAGREARARQGEALITVSNFNKKGALRGSFITTPASRSNILIARPPLLEKEGNVAHFNATRLNPIALSICVPISNNRFS
jgi:hypothetical protein